MALRLELMIHRPLGYHGRDSLMVKFTESGLACHEFESGPAEDPPYRKGRCTLNIPRRSNSLRLVWWGSSSSPYHDSKL
ncbi:hypothetical protein TNCV_4859481 [Trichonephila clavipes]|nr:hypothetical protein TNCV_4859481 [Trichonephila clavipes]